MALLPSFERSTKNSTLESQNFWDKVQQAKAEDLNKLLDEGKAHNQQIGFGDRVVVRKLVEYLQNTAEQPKSPKHRNSI